MTEPTALREVHDVSRFGGKSAQLGASLRGGLPVPAGFALSVDLVDRVASGDRAAILRCIDAFSRLEANSVAVRSSAIGEDGLHASFAGQHLTRLAVTDSDAAIEAVVAVWESARAESALAYRARLGIRGEIQIAVLMQSMVDAECAGVMFTRDPITGADVRVVEAAWGLGEAVVSGLVDPDRYRFTRGGLLTEQTIGDKEVAIRPSAAGSTDEVPVPDALRRLPCLDAERVRALDALASDCEALFADGAAHDVEWAFEHGTLFLLQRRAVTR